MKILGTLNEYSVAASKLYAVCSHNPLLTDLEPLPAAFHHSLRCVYWGAGIKYPEVDDDSTVFREPSVHHEERVIVGATGGKDSLAVALCLRSEGYSVVLMHAKGVNPAYSHEAKATRTQADALGMDYIEVAVDVGKKEYLENPARNHALLLMQASFAEGQQAGTLAQGLHTQRAAASQPFDTGWSDCAEMAEAGAEMMFAVAPWLNVRLDNLPESDTESIDCVVHHAPDLLPLVQSCMLPLRFHAAVRRANNKKAGYDLLPGRCGSCYKCCREWLVLREHGYYEESPTYREHVEQLLVDKHAAFCYGSESAEWGRDRILRTFLARPSGKW